MAPDDIEALVAHAQTQVDEASEEIRGLRDQLENCHGELEYLHAAVDELLGTVDELVVFVGEDMNVEGVSDSVALRTGVAEHDLVGKPIDVVADQLEFDALAAAVRDILNEPGASRSLTSGPWAISVKAVADGRSGAVVVARRDAKL